MQYRLSSVVTLQYDDPALMRNGIAPVGGPVGGVVGATGARVVGGRVGGRVGGVVGVGVVGWCRHLVGVMFEHEPTMKPRPVLGVVPLAVVGVGRVGHIA